MAAASEIFVRLMLENSQYNKALEDSRKRWAGFAASTGTAGKELMAGAALALAPLALSIREASKMEETMNKFDVVFAKNSRTVKQWSDEYANAVGRSQQQLADFMANTQDLMVPIGFDDRQAVELSKTISTLAIDLASFNNGTDTDALRDLHAALTGSGEVMKKYGVICSETAVQQRMLQMGFDPKSANEQQKVLARLNIILDGTKAAQGDAARSAGSFANQTKALAASISDAAVGIGQIFLPVVTPLISDVADLVKGLGEWANNNKDLIITFGKAVVLLGAVGASLIAISAIAKAGTMIIAGYGLTLKGYAILKGIFAATSAAMGVYSATATTAASRTVALNAAMASLNINPVALGFTAAAAAILGIAYAFRASETAAKEAAAEQRKAAAESTQAAITKREALEKEQAGDRQRIERLRELSREENLSGAKKIEAANLIEILSSRYGELGVSIDGTTGKINLQASAFERVNAAMKENQISALQGELEAINREFIVAKNQFDNRSAISRLGGVSRFDDLSPEQWQEQFPFADQEYREQLKPILDAWGRMKQKAQELYDLQNNIQPPAASLGGPDLAAATQAQEALNTAATDSAKRRMSELDRELAAVREIRDERLKSLETLEKYNASQMVSAEKDLAKSAEWNDVEGVKVAEIRMAQVQEKLDGLKNQRIEIEADFKIDSTALKEAAKRELDHLRTGISDRKVDRQMRRAETESDRELDQLSKSDPEGYKRELEKLLQDAKGGEAAADNRLQDALAKAYEDNQLDGEEENRLKLLEEISIAQAALVDKYQQKMDAAREGLEQSQTMNFGSFYANTLAVASGGTAADKTAQNTAETVQILARIADLFQFGNFGQRGGVRLG